MRKSASLLFTYLAISISVTAWGGEHSGNNQYEGGITLTITNKPFDSKAHRIQKCGETVCLIDGKPVYGAYGRIPKQEVVSLVFQKNDRKVALDVSGMYDPNVNNANIKKYLKVRKWGEDTYEVAGYFSLDDGDDSVYICMWLVMRDGSIRNYIGDYGALARLTEEVEKDFGVGQ